VLHAHGPDDLNELTRVLGAEMLRLGGVATGSESEAVARIDEAINSGEALQRLKRCAALQGAQIDLRDPDEPWFQRNLHSNAVALPAPSTGYVIGIDAEAVGWAGVALRAGRERKEDAIDPAAYIYLDKKCGEPVTAGEPLCHFAGSPDLSPARSERARALLQRAYTIGPQPLPPQPLILDVLR
jgi:pyrimidine-nucleoside phosphorylase